MYNSTSFPLTTTGLLCVPPKLLNSLAILNTKHRAINTIKTPILKFKHSTTPYTNGNKAKWKRARIYTKGKQESETYPYDRRPCYFLDTFSLLFTNLLCGSMDHYVMPTCIRYFLFLFD